MSGAAALPRPVLFGILNVTPDSFSDGGRYADVDAAVARAVELRAAGADVIDVGGESTRPGAGRVAPEQELARVLPVVRELAARDIPTSIDTMRATTAIAAVTAGAEYVNDVSGGLADPEMLAAVAATGARYIAMHWRGHSDGMQQQAHYADVVAEVRDELAARVEAATAAGVGRDRLVLDPGVGFAKTADHNWAVLRGLPALAELGLPLLVGASRKKFLAEYSIDASDATARDVATALTSVLAARSGAWGLRVHDVAGTARALALASRWSGGAA